MLKARPAFFFLTFLLSNFCLTATNWDQVLPQRGMVDPCTLDTTIKIHLKYATSDNFMGKVLYTGLQRAWLRPEAAKKLVKAQQLLRKEHPGKHLLVYDASRPMTIQKQMWKLVCNTGKTYYVANPQKGGGLHNYGMAVDLTIIDEHGNPLPMGTPFDYFGKEANTDKEEELVRTKKITHQEYSNRLLLRRIMRAAGFTTVTSEWWHFNACSRTFARQHYPLID